jgi:hypothetical protein
MSFVGFSASANATLIVFVVSVFPCADDECLGIPIGYLDVYSGYSPRDIWNHNSTSTTYIDCNRVSQSWQLIRILYFSITRTRRMRGA